MAVHSERPAAAFDHPWIFRSVELGWHARSHPSHALCEMSRSALSREASSHRRRHRQPGVECARNKRASWIDHAWVTMREKRLKGKKRHILRRYAGLLDRTPSCTIRRTSQDRDGGELGCMVDRYSVFIHRRCRGVYADGGSSRPPVVWRRAL